MIPPRKTITITYTTSRPKEDVYKFPEEFYLKENAALYQRARKLCLLYKAPYAEARERYFAEREQMYPDPKSYTEAIPQNTNGVKA